jgi:hypothetical protein
MCFKRSRQINSPPTPAVTVDQVKRQTTLPFSADANPRRPGILAAARRETIPKFTAVKPAKTTQFEQIARIRPLEMVNCKASTDGRIVFPGAPFEGNA